MGISENIKRFRSAKDWTQEQLADKVGVTRSTVTQWETGWSQPRMGAVEKLAAAFSVSVSDMVAETDAANASSSSTREVDAPLYGSIAAGTPIEMIEVNEYHSIPAAIHKRYPNAFLLKVEGNSMDKILPNGCYALIDPCSHVENDGDPYAVCVNGYDATIKRVRKLNNGFELVPDSTDPTYPVQTYNYNEPGTETITVIGRVVYYVLPYDWKF